MDDKTVISVDTAGGDRGVAAVPALQLARVPAHVPVLLLGNRADRIPEGDWASLAAEHSAQLGHPAAAHLAGAARRVAADAGDGTSLALALGCAVVTSAVAATPPPLAVARALSDAGPAVAAALDDMAEPADAAATSTDPAPRRARASGPKSNANEKAPPADATDALVREATLLGDAWAQLKRGNIDRARRLARTHARDFRQGEMAPEREAILAIADCRAEARGAKQRAERFLKTHAASPHAKAVRQACEP